MTPDRFIKQYYRPDDYLAAVTIDRKHGHVRQEFATARQLVHPSVIRKFEFANKAGHDMYLSVNTFHPGTKSRVKENVAEVRSLYLDIDSDGKRVLSGIRHQLPLPTTILESSPDRYQVRWKVEGFTVDQAEATVRGMARQFGADADVWDAARILRVPGYVNHKNGFVVHETQRGTDRVYSAADFPRYEQTAEHTLYTGASTAPRTASGQIDQSAEEWRETIRQLAHGRSPDDVRRELEGRAANRGKPAAAKYAARTVQKASEWLQNARQQVQSQGQSL